MKSAEFLSIIAANANKTKNLRSFFGPWSTSINQVPNEIAGKFGRIVALLQAKIEEGFICNKETEYLLIYNFQPLYQVHDAIYYSLDMLRKPLVDIKKVKEKVGEPFQLVINGNTGEVINNSKGMIEMGIATAEEIAENELEPAFSYGNYNLYKAPCSFLTLFSDKPLLPELLFKGEYDQTKTLQECKVYENLLNARHLVTESKAVGRYIAEIPYTKDEVPTLKKQGLGKRIIKFINHAENTVTVNSDPNALAKEEPIEDELKRLKDAFGTIETEASQKARNLPESSASHIGGPSAFFSQGSSSSMASSTASNLPKNTAASKKFEKHG